MIFDMHCHHRRHHHNHGMGSSLLGLVAVGALVYAGAKALHRLADQ